MASSHEAHNNIYNICYGQESIVLILETKRTEWGKEAQKYLGIRYFLSHAFLTLTCDITIINDSGGSRPGEGQGRLQELEMAGDAQSDFPGSLREKYDGPFGLGNLLSRYL